MGMKVIEVHVERGTIGGTDPAKSSLTAPEFHAALVVRVEDPHVLPLSKDSDRCKLLEVVLLHVEIISECDGCLSSPLEFPE